MSRVFYNGVTIDRCQVTAKRQTVLAGFQYLYTRHVYSIKGQINPWLNSNGFNPAIIEKVFVQPPDVPQGFARAERDNIGFARAERGGRVPGIEQIKISGGAFMPAQTDVAIRHVLMQPRKIFQFSLGDKIIIQQPLKGFTCDADNGPTPLECNVVRIEGTKTFFVEFVIQVTVNENQIPNTKAGYGGQSPLLAHEWTMTHSVDADFFTTRYIDGRAVFRGDVLQKFGLIPDQFRDWLGHALPSGFRRQNVSVTALPDGNTVRYQIVDRQRVLNFDPNLISRAEGILSMHSGSPGLESMVIGGLRQRSGGYSWQGSPIGNVVLAGLGLVGAGLWFWNNWGAVTSGNFPADDQNDRMSLFARVPMQSWRLQVRLWGTPQSNPNRLALEGYRMLREFTADIANLLMPTFVGGGQAISAELFRQVSRFLGGYDTTLTFDKAGKFVELEEQVHSSILVSIASLYRLNQRPAGAGGGGLPRVPNIVSTFNPMRGTYLGAAVAQALKDTSDDSRQAPNPAYIVEGGNAAQQALVPNVNSTRVYRRQP